MSKNSIDKIYDEENDPIRWIDLMMFRCWLLGKENQNIPVDWARERMKKFMSKPTKVEFFTGKKIKRIPT